MDENKFIDRDSWHFKLYERGVGHMWLSTVPQIGVVHTVNRCRYIKIIMSLILNYMFKTLAVIWAIGVFGILPLAVFFLCIDYFDQMAVTSILFGSAIVCIPVIWIKRLIHPLNIYEDKAINFVSLVAESVADSITSVKNNLCPMMIVKQKGE